jgi:RNA polymerase sigma-70 factor (ECF subfamily)
MQDVDASAAIGIAVIDAGRDASDPAHADRVLVDAVLAGDAGAFERLVRRYQGLCWHVVLRMVHHPDDARELCQETFLRVHRYLSQYRHESPLKSWIGQVAYSVAKRHLERRRIPLATPAADAPEPLDTVADPHDVEAACAEADMARRLHAAIARLPPQQRAILTLYHLDDVPIGEIARITGLATGTIKSHLFRSRQQLRVALEHPPGVDP